MEAVHLDSEMIQIGPQLLVSRVTGKSDKLDNRTLTHSPIFLYARFTKKRERGSRAKIAGPSISA